jgi:RHS repeat-associated protein
VVNSSQSYFPWGETKGTSNPQDTWNFATYWQDSWTGLDYANNRYYSNAYGRFMTPDPYQASVGPEDPGSWNRYAYTRGDPANRNDPSGLCDSDDPSCVSACDPADPICVAANSCDPADASCSLGSTGGGTGGSSSLPGSITYPVNGGPGDIGSLTVSLTGGGFTFQFADAADAAVLLGICATDPVCVVVGGVVASAAVVIYVAAKYGPAILQAIQNEETSYERLQRCVAQFTQDLKNCRDAYPPNSAGLKACSEAAQRAYRACMKKDVN